MVADGGRTQVSLNLMIDKKNHRVAFAESDGEFVDILFSFLTMPMGTIVRFLNKQTNPETLGSFTSLYRGLMELKTEYLGTEACKTMLLRPNNSVETLLQKLKLNIDDTEPTKYFTNTNRVCGHLSTVKGIRCPCKRLMVAQIFFKDSSATVGEGGTGRVFVSPGAMFIITDDLQVLPVSFDSLLSLGINDLEAFHLKTVNVGLEEIYGLLKLSLLSKSTLTDMFLGDQCIISRNTNLGLINFKTETETSAEAIQMSVKLIVRKADNKVFFAEATEDFVNLLFSLLTIPIGLVLELLGGHSSLKCVDNLYKSVCDLNAERFMGSNHLKAMLVSPKLPPLYPCKNQLLDVMEVNLTPQVCTKTYFGEDKYLSLTRTSDNKYLSIPQKIVYPESVVSSAVSNEGYVKGPATFMVTDDLVVTPFSSISSIRLLNSLNVNIGSFENRVISVGKGEALSILQASLISTSALTTGFNTILKKRKQELP